MVTVETAVVYRCSDGRRFFTKRAAFLHEAVKRLKARTDMEGCDDELRGGEHYQRTYYTDSQWERMMKVAQRYYRRFRAIATAPAA